MYKLVISVLAFYFFRELMQTLGTCHIKTTAHHHRARELVEIFHRQLQVTLAVQPDTSKCTDYLPVVIYGLRDAVKITSTELVYGTQLNLSEEFFIKKHNSS